MMQAVLSMPSLHINQARATSQVMSASHGQSFCEASWLEMLWPMFQRYADLFRHVLAGSKTVETAQQGASFLHHILHLFPWGLKL